MTDTNMPAAEANSYELAFHVLPTVAEGEVPTVFQGLKDTITKHGGQITDEEAPARFDLAYEIMKYLEGRNRKFSSAYFGWIRFTAEPAMIAEIDETVGGTKELLRHLLIKLTKVEEAQPFYFHEALAEQTVTTVSEPEDVIVEATVEDTKPAPDEAEAPEDEKREEPADAKEAAATSSLKEAGGAEAKDKV